MKISLIPLLAVVLAACGSAPQGQSVPPEEQTVAPTHHVRQTPQPSAAPAVVEAVPDCPNPYLPAKEDPSKRGHYTKGGLFKPGMPDSVPDEVPNVDCIIEPVVTDEPLSKGGNNPSYTVLGKRYKVLKSADGYVERGLASFYGEKFHGRKTSNQEIYDMYQFTAAHKSLPLPTFALVTNLENGKDVVVRINDRGPFHDDRLIDLSYAAAVKLGLVNQGVGRVEVRALNPNDPKLSALLASRKKRCFNIDGVAAGQSSEMDQLVGGLSTQTDGVGQNIHCDDVKTTETQAFGATTQNTQATAVKHETSNQIAINVLLQVASFATRSNAEQALAKLVEAGIPNAFLSNAMTDNGTLWNIRVSAADNAGVNALSSRIVDLGFPRPEIIRE